MVITKPEWFKKKKSDIYSIKMSWKGWVYTIITISVLFTGLSLPQTMVTQLTVSGLFLFLFMDMIITSYKSMDEREKAHYSISMRNMALGMLITIILSSIVIDHTNTEGSLNTVIVFTTLMGGLIGFVTRYKLEKEN